MVDRHVSLPKPFASGDVHEWFQRFEICCKANGWNDATKVLKLPTLLEGEALAVWLELSEEQQGNYATAKEELSSTMMPMAFVSLDEFHRRKLRPGEALSVFVHDVKKLLEQAMPGLDKPARDQLLLHQFLSGLPALSRKPTIGLRHRTSQTLDDHRGSQPSCSSQERTEWNGIASGTSRTIDGTSSHVVNIIEWHSKRAATLSETLLQLESHRSCPARMSLPPPSHWPSSLFCVWPNRPHRQGLSSGKRRGGACEGQQAPLSPVSPQDVNIVTIAVVAEGDHHSRVDRRCSCRSDAGFGLVRVPHPA